MNTPTPPISLLAKIGLWFVDLAKMPGRVKLLADGLEADRDPRPVCRSCGVGRVGKVERRVSQMGTASGIGTCDNCNARWHINAATGALGMPVGGG